MIGAVLTLSAVLSALAAAGLFASAGASVYGARKKSKQFEKQVDLEKFATSMADLKAKSDMSQKRQLLLDLQKEKGKQDTKAQNWATAAKIMGISQDTQTQRLQMLMALASQLGGVAGQEANTGTTGTLPMSMYLQR